ncbi:MAG: XrtA/PEP-CTERM system exopolysaccharide export protein [Thiomonas sp.]|jgi:polysaccharide export outer membrane protein
MSVRNPRFSLWRVIAASAVGLSLSACAVNNYPPAPDKINQEAYHYKVGAGDTLNVNVWRNPDLSMTIQVRPDGKISTPLAPDVQAAGRTPGEIAKEIEARLSKYVRDPVVSVVVTGFHGPYNQQIRIVGQAVRPTAIPYRENMTLLDVMIAAGGLTEFADGNAAILERHGKTYSIRLGDLLKRGQMSANVPVEPGDVIIIPQSMF